MGHSRPQKEEQISISEVEGDEQTSLLPFVLAVLSVTTAKPDKQKSFPCFLFF